MATLTNGKSKFVPRSVALDEFRVTTSSSHSSPNNKRNDVRFSFVGFLENSLLPSTQNILDCGLDEEEEDDDDDDDDMLSRSSPNGFYSSANSYFGSTPGSSNCTPNSITNELTNIPDLNEVEDTRREVKKILYRCAEMDYYTIVF